MYAIAYSLKILYRLYRNMRKASERKPENNIKRVIFYYMIKLLGGL